MSQYLERSELFDQIIRLAEEDRKEPIRVIQRFFSDYRLHECRHILWSIVETCLTTENSEFSEPEERANLMLRYEHFEELLEASYLLWGKGGLS